MNAGRPAPICHLHIDRPRLDTLEGDGLDMGNHAATPAGPTCAHHRPGTCIHIMSYLN